MTMFHWMAAFVFPITTKMIPLSVLHDMVSDIHTLLVIDNAKTKPWRVLWPQCTSHYRVLAILFTIQLALLTRELMRPLSAQIRMKLNIGR